jgi:glyoxylase-like metal-dependent hydrolase (beta-lactamase superfamily II)
VLRADREQIESPAALFQIRYDAYRPQGIFYDAETRQGIMASLGEAQAVDLTFRGGERLRLGPDWEVEILHLPGHSRGHLGLLDLKHRALFAGDAIHGSVYLDVHGKPALCPTYLYVPAYLQTIRFIEHLSLDGYCGCHWPVKYGPEIKAFCEESRQFVDQAERLLLEALKQPKTLKELCFEVGPKLGGWPVPVNAELSAAFAGHLHKLEDKGAIQTVAGRDPKAYRRR